MIAICWKLLELWCQNQGMMKVVKVWPMTPKCIGILLSSSCFYVSAPEPKAQVHYCDHALSVVRPSLTFHIFDFSSETAEQNSMKLDRKQDLKVLN